MNTGDKKQLQSELITKVDRQILVLRRQAKKYPSAKKKITEIRKQQAWNKFLAQ